MEERVILAEYGNHAQAELTVNLLSEYGIESFIWSDDCSGVSPGLSFIRGVKVSLYKADLDRAKDILKGQEE
ncbi:MAG: DUF2007 domain-containing protein [Spirochaetales bacterium]|nr:DUF2007 domain-containing protein [Spirochaetales bacterium]